MTLDTDTRYRVAGYDDIAFYYDGPHTEPDEDTEWTGLENETGLVRMVMVGDDRHHVVDPADCTPIADEDYCGSCGQVGCSW